MKTFKSRSLAWLATGALTVAAAAPLAAAARGDCPTGGAGPMHGDPAHMEQMAGRRFDALHDALKLSAAQEPAWKAFRDGITNDMAQMAKSRPDPAALRDKPAPERMAAMLEHAKLHQAQMEKHLAALTKFYDQLTPEQKKTFDAQHMMGPRWGDGRHGPRGGGPGPAPKDGQL
ncbi:hypothetical protein GCM10025771_10900 [Niveibacterium umoris]|uniref:Spy/CpxP family protein refolding chaperone n=1 Tax=Niveibacterium umoris TaxID=1193620 RepID=A0A840BPG3_9RHOO|nr:Spy/CpxP family protein refolding chaperone [Niveibacterium umoris]MBB4013359.1 Spy/CpxP family protein refolding chaperone [Niveibacterium umoris]